MSHDFVTFANDLLVIATVLTYGIPATIAAIYTYIRLR